eukprot:Skav233152  [mRNA]  locus=scaffold1669:218963:220468:+ [translate_table: standard]
MAQALEKQVLASQKFLRGLRALPHYGTIRDGQWQSIDRKIQRTGSLTAEKISELVGMLEEELWSEEQVSSLKEKLAALVADESNKDRRQSQDFTRLPHYLNEEMWNMVRSRVNRVEVLQRLTALAGNLGLRLPSEFSFAALLTLAFCCFEQKTETEKRKLVDEYKDKIRKWLRPFPPLTELSSELPGDVSSMPAELLAAAYPQGFVPHVPPGLSMAEVQQCIASYPVRRRGSDKIPLPEHSAPSSSSQLDHGQLADFAIRIVNGVQRSCADTTSSVPLAVTAAPVVAQPLAIMDKAPSTVEPAPSNSAVEETAMSDKAAPVAHEPCEPTAEAQTKVSQGLDALKAQLRPDRHERPVHKRPPGRPPRQGRVEPAGSSQTSASLRGKRAMARPAAASVAVASQKTKMARPAAACAAVASAKKHMARPAAACAAVASKKTKQTSKKAMKMSTDKYNSASVKRKRQALAKVVPAADLKKYKFGCPTCRETPYCTPSCWTRRGFRL